MSTFTPSSASRQARMLAAVSEAGVQFAVGQAVRFWPEYVKTKELYDAGELGVVKYARASRLSVHPLWSEWYRKPENSGRIKTA